MPRHLILAERHERQDLHPAGQRLGQPRQEEHMCGPGEEEAPRSLIAIDLELDGREQLRRLLHLIDHGEALRGAHERRWIAARRGERRRVVEREVPPTALGGHALGQRALADLPGTVQQHDPRVVQRVAQGRFDIPPVHGGILATEWRIYKRPVSGGSALAMTVWGLR